MKRIIITFSILLFSYLMLSQNVILSVGFEDEEFPPNGWINANYMGDENEYWYRAVKDEGFNTHSGIGAAVSESECSGDTGCKFPDNWLISPKIDVPSDASKLLLTFYVAALHHEKDKCEEYFEVMISAELDIHKFVSIYDERLDEDTADWSIREIELDDLVQQKSFYFAIRHCESTGISALLIDDIKLTTDGTVSEKDITIPSPQATLSANYPNPFNPSTTIIFAISDDSAVNVCIDVFNIKGQKIRNLVNDNYTAGEHRVVWNGHDDNGNEVVSGIYFYQMRTGDYTETKKMIMIK